MFAWGSPTAPVKDMINLAAAKTFARLSNPQTGNMYACVTSQKSNRVTEWYEVEYRVDGAQSADTHAHECRAMCPQSPSGEWTHYGKRLLAVRHVRTRKGERKVTNMDVLSYADAEKFLWAISRLPAWYTPNSN